ERLLYVLSVTASSRRVPGGHKGQRSQADQPQVVRLPVALAALVAGQPFQAALQRLLAGLGYFPLTLGPQGGSSSEQGQGGKNHPAPLHGNLARLEGEKKSIPQGKPEKQSRGLPAKPSTAPQALGRAIPERVAFVTFRHGGILGEFTTRMAGEGGDRLEGSGLGAYDDARWFLPSPGACMTRRALITGVTGQDGSYLASFLLSKGYEVHGMVRRASTENFERIAHLRDHVALHQADLLDQLSLVRLI